MKNLSHYWDLTVVLTRKDITVRYKNSVLGYLWSIANPLAFTLVFYVVFNVVGLFRMENYTIFLITGLFPWQCFSNSLGVSPIVFSTNSSIIKKINFPRSILPLATVLQDMIHFVLSIPVIILFLLIFRKAPAFSWLYGVPILLVIHLFLTYGVCLLISSINLFFRDMEKLVNIFIVFLFYFTPVLYPVDMIPDKYRFFTYLNPVAPLMINWRNLLLDGALDWKYLAAGAGHSAVSFALGYVVYRKLSGRFAEVT